MPLPLFNKLKEKKMYRTIKRTPTSLNVNETMEGETIEKMIERRLNNGETAQDIITTSADGSAMLPN